jgi:hypothetical protein
MHFYFFILGFQEMDFTETQTCGPTYINYMRYILLMLEQ